jgi:polysaccharide lyase-like protein
VSRRGPLGVGGRSKEPQGGTLIFQSSFEDHFWQWDSCQWKDRNDNCQSYTGGDYSGAVVALDGRAHVARWEVRNGDIPPFGGGERAEAGELAAADVSEGDERWYGLDVKFPSDFPDPLTSTASGWFIVLQYHPVVEGSSPSVALELDTDGSLYIVNNNSAPNFQREEIGPIVRGKWVRYVLHVMFSTSDSTGFVEVWQDGVLAVPETSFHTLFGAGAHYLKLGIYRSASNTTTAVVYHDNLLITAP